MIITVIQRNHIEWITHKGESESNYVIEPAQRSQESQSDSIIRKDKEHAPGGSLPERVFLLYHNIEQAIRNLRVNANLQLTLEGVCLAIKDSLYGKGDWDTFSKRRQDLPL